MIDCNTVTHHGQLYHCSSGEGPNLVLLHGWGMSSVVWEDIIADLHSDMRITCLDLPGHGYSPWLEGQATIDTWAQACLQAAPAEAIWLGWSLGGTIALQAALMAPSRIRALVMITATPCFVANDYWPYGMQVDTITRFHNNLHTNWTETLGRFLTLQVRGGNNAIQVLRTLHQRLAVVPTPNHAAIETGLVILRTTDLTSKLPQLKPPSLWLYGNRDTIVSWHNAKTLQKLLPSAQIVVIPGAAHAPLISHRQEFLQVLQRFISEL